MTSINQSNTLEKSIQAERDETSKRQAEKGRRYPPEFIANLGESLNQLVWDWMNANNIPEEIIQAFELGQVLNQKAGWLKDGRLVDMLAADLLTDVPEAASLIWKLGGAFYDVHGNELLNPNQPPVFQK